MKTYQTDYFQSVKFSVHGQNFENGVVLKTNEMLKTIISYCKKYLKKFWKSIDIIHNGWYSIDVIKREYFRKTKPR